MVRAFFYELSLKNDYFFTNCPFGLSTNPLVSYQSRGRKYDRKHVEMRNRNVGKCLAWSTRGALTSSVWLRQYDGD